MGYDEHRNKQPRKHAKYINMLGAILSCVFMASKAIKVATAAL